MTLVYAGVCSHAPGIVGRAQMVDDKASRDRFYSALINQSKEIRKTEPAAIVVVAAEHFANFFMNNMPPFCMGMADSYEGPIEDPAWLGIERTRIPGSKHLSEKLIQSIMTSVDLAYAEEWKCDHGIMVPLHFLTPKYDVPIVPVNINCQGPPLAPLNRVWAFGKALRRACDAIAKPIAIVGTGGLSHWPATPDSGKINEDWDREFLRQLAHQDKDALLAYTDEDVYRDGGQGGFEIRTYIATAAAAGGPLNLQFYTASLPIFAVGCTVGRFELS